jgi:hypothetical protein
VSYTVRIDPNLVRRCCTTRCITKILFWIIPLKLTHLNWVSNPECSSTSSAPFFQ